MKDRFLDVKDVMEITGKKHNWASTRIRELNEELEKEGYTINRGKIPKNYFCERHHLDPNDFD